MATSHVPYLAHVAEEVADSALELNAIIRKAMLRLCGWVLLIIHVGVVLKFFGLDLVLWYLAIGVIIYVGAALVAAMVAITPPTWGYNLFTGVLGELNKLPEGLQAAREGVNKVWRFWLWSMAYSAVALIAIGVFNIEDNLMMVPVLLTFALMLIVTSNALFKNSAFFPWFVFVFCLVGFVFCLFKVAPGFFGLKVRYYMDQMGVNVADTAEDAALRAKREAIATKRAACFGTLKGRTDKGELVPEAEYEKCRQIGVEKPAAPIPAPTAAASAPQRPMVIPPPPAAVTTPTRVAANTDPASWTCTPFKEFDYDPQNMFRMEFGTGPGKYEIEITGMRRHTLQRNIMAGGQRTDGREWYATCLFDPDGRAHDCKERKGEATGDSLPNFSVKHEDVSRWIDRPLAVPIPTEPYGKVIVRTTENKVVPIGSKGRFETKGEKFVLDLNVDPFPTNYQGLGFKGVLRRCEAS